ncbi:centrosome-associated protein CEP250 isoform X1 [Carex littledalei]|uniref:Centrosome-associated protein CEP250 isoform X1 n=1 Tax=Carex littledalei TaxID=544730 RepID=A0A833VNS1_9POAL|nr:centrosome-associated protein CEP250 isoform X1 [Carex littledalei]
MVVVSAILCGNLPSTSCACASTVNVISNKKLRTWLPFKSQKREKISLYLSRPVVKNLCTGVTSNYGGNGSIESARVLLEQLFAKTQNLESTSAEDSELSTSLEVLRSEFEAALSTLRKRERDLKDAERRVLVEERTFKQTKLELERREREIAASFEKQEQLKVELEAVRLNFANQVRQIRDLQYLLRAKDDKLVGSKSTIMEKSAEIEKLKVELEKKDQMVVKLGSVIESKEEKLIEYEKILKDKEATIINLKQEIERKEIELADSNELRELNEERLKTVERELQDQTSAWLNARNEFQELKSQASSEIGSIKESVDDFKRVRCLLDALRSELASSRELLTSSRAKVEFQANQLEEQSHEISQQRKMLLSYSENLESIKSEVDRRNMDLRSERAKLTQLELQVAQETSKVKTLEEELARERDKLEEKSREVQLLTEELEKKKQDFDIMQNVFQIRESELAEARVQIQNLKSELGSITSLAEKKDKDLVEAKKRLEGVSDEIIQLRKLMDGKEEQFLQLMSRLHEKEEHIVAMQDELQEIKMRHAEATLVVHELTDLTTNLAANEELTEIGRTGSDAERELDIRLEMELKMVKQTLREKEVELLEAQRQLAVKEKELKSIRESWKEKEKEIPENAKLEIDDLRELYSLVQETVAEKNLGDLVTEMLQMELVQVEAETTKIALQKITELTENIVRSIGNNKLEGSNLNFKIEEGCFEEAEKGIFRLFSLTERLVGEAGMSNNER